MPFLGYQMAGGLEARLVSPWEDNGDLQSYVENNDVDDIQRLRFVSPFPWTPVFVS